MPPRPRLKLPTTTPSALPRPWHHPRPSCTTTPAPAAAAAAAFSTSPRHRHSSSKHAHKDAKQQPEKQQPPARWLSDLRARIGRVVMFGCSAAQTERAGEVLAALAGEWRELTAGAEGFLTGGRRGLEGHRVVWGEMDSFQHVNNVAYIRWAESARVNWVTNFAVHADSAHRKEWRELMQPVGTGLILKSIRCDYKFPIVYPDKISVYHRLTHRPSESPTPPTSLILECLVLSHNHRRIAARVFEDIAIYDYKRAAKTAMPAFMHAMLDRTWDEQVAETERSRRRIWELVAEVEALEGETWNREGAVEDLGSAGKGR